ncbi:putative lipid II flippase FtsW [Thermogemmatispora carboxidivorans]|uniref:putative lipid II flippase FtsW n=1 Tax=Thermogemmatispora carboxidivorans TaxID=1382306 RepID=UPI00069BC721|nr:putative lipid II flippase FtsW [Thermogemmatispora carboxidivorans]
MPDERQRQARQARLGNQGRRREALPHLRSPALEALARDASAGQGQSERDKKRPPAGRTPRKPVSSQAYLAAEEQLKVPALARKKLPARAVRLLDGVLNRVEQAAPARPERSGLTAGWRRRLLAEEESATATAAPPTEMSEDEQRRLEELEMRLPRVAGRIDHWLLIVVLALLCLGLVMVYSASSFISASLYGDASYIFQRELLWAVLGVIAMLVTMHIDYRLWRRFSLIGMLAALALLVLVLKFGTSAYGATRWLTFGSFISFQPSELVKLVLALYIADWLARKGNQVRTFLYGLAPFVILVGVVLGLVLLEKDMGTAVIIAVAATAMFFSAGANIAQLLLALACGGLVFLTQAFRGYRYFRLLGFLDPFRDVTGINLQLYQSLLALGSGGWFGLGLGASRQKTGYLPLPYIDSIFAIIGEELGFIGCATVMLLFLWLAFRGFRLARRTPDLYGSLLATGITTWIVVQAMINIGSSTASIPYTGVPLPFISFGGSSLVVSMAAVGVLLNISRYVQEPDDPLFSRRTLELRLKRGRQRAAARSRQGAG